MKKYTTEQYIKSILRKLKCSSRKKEEIEKELRADIQIAIENGETWEDVRERMGTPGEIAQEFNENFTPEELRSGKKKSYFYIAGAVLVLLGIAVAIPFIIRKEPKSDKKDEVITGEEPAQIETHTDYDEKEVIEQAKRIISLLDAEDYDTIRNQYADTIMKTMIIKSEMDEVKQTICADWGNFVSYGNFYTDGLIQDGKKYVVVQVNVVYEQVGVTYTLSFDEEGKLSGLYMR